jgi:hypothetical protein
MEGRESDVARGTRLLKLVIVAVLRHLVVWIRSGGRDPRREPARMSYARAGTRRLGSPGAFEAEVPLDMNWWIHQIA